jgi:hypothetical protein
MAQSFALVLYVNELTDDGKGVSPTHPLHFTPQKHYF